MKVSILIVDDSWFQRLNLRNLLADSGYEFAEADNGENSLRLLAERSFDCILLDLLMPGMDGFAVLEALREQQSRIPVVVVSADIQHSTRQRCLELGAKALVNKPVTESSGLPGVIQSILGDSPCA